MRRTREIAAALPAFFLAACQSITSPANPKTSQPEQGGATALVRGQAIAALTCAQCHGTDYAGERILDGKTTPTLNQLRSYTDDAFDRLLCTGVASDGSRVKEMTTPTVVTLSADDRAAVRNYLAQYFGTRSGTGSGEAGSGYPQLHPLR